jgi:hypothetical protein
MNRLGSGSGSGLDPDSIRSVDPDGGLQQDQHCRHHEHAGTHLSSKGMNRLGSGSGSGLDPDPIRSVDPDGGLQQDQHCRYHEYAGTYLSSKA